MMVSLRHLSRYLLATAALSCLSVTVLPVEITSARVSPHAEAQTESRSNHASQLEGKVAYRGTGRLSQQSATTFAHRGSGRIDDGLGDINDVAYRGSGRISPDNLDVPEFV